MKEIGDESVHAFFSLLSKQLSKDLIAMDKNNAPTIIIKSGKTIRQIEIKDLLYIECDCYVSTFSMADGSKIDCTYSLAYFEEKLSPWRFERISRNVIVSLRDVVAIKSKIGNRKTVIMKDGREFDIAFRKWKRFKVAFYK
jgi:DNA-binding LytR/AlgR family response regulator